MSIARLAIDPSATLHVLRLVTSAVALLITLRVAVVTRLLPLHIMAAGTALWLIGDIAEILAQIAASPPTAAVQIAQYAHLLARIVLTVSALAAMGSLLGAATLRRSTDTALSLLVAAFAVVTLSQVTDAGRYAFAITAVDATYLTLAGLALCGAGGPQRTPYRVLMLAALVLTTTDVIDIYGDYFSASVPDGALQFGWALQSVIRTIGVLMIYRGFGRGITTIDATFRESRPMLLAVLSVVGAASALEPIRHWSVASILLGLAICAVVAVREWMITAEQRSLARSEARAAAELLRQAEYDDLTGLYRRDSILRRLEAAMAAGRVSNTPVAVLSVDLDHFKEINDTFGHDTGDRVLRGVAEHLRLAARTAQIGRWGGDEFVVVQAPAGSAGDLERLMRAVEQAVDTEIDVAPGAAIRPSGSVGLAVVEDWDDPANAADVFGPGQLIARADHRAGEAKRGALRRRASSDDRTADPTDMSSALRALDEERLTVWYQPIVDLRTDRVVGAEALIRLIEPDGTVRSAGEFLPMLVAAGHGEHITDLVVRQSFEDFAGGPAADMGWVLSINLSERDLAGSRALALIRREMERTGLPGKRLIVEIDEHIAPDDPVGAAVDGLRELGVALALDDFGARSSSFGQISHLRPTYLKLDAALAPQTPGAVGRTEWSTPGVELADAFTRLAHQLDIRVVAEGIETAEQLELIRGISCDLGQGFHWSGAVPLDQLIGLAAGIDQEATETQPITRRGSRGRIAQAPAEFPAR